MTDLDFMRELYDELQPTVMFIDQCVFGARAKTPTLLRLFNVPAPPGHIVCQHKRQQWILRSTGRTYWASNPHLNGKEGAVPCEEQDQHSHEPVFQQDYISKGAAAYPSNMNE